MHSSRMCIVRCSGDLGEGGGGVSAQGDWGVGLGVVSAQGGSAKWGTPSWIEFLTHIGENITFRQCGR